MLSKELLLNLVAQRTDLQGAARVSASMNIQTCGAQPCRLLTRAAPCRALSYSDLQGAARVSASMNMYVYIFKKDVTRCALSALSTRSMKRAHVLVCMPDRSSV
jgi:hypothetical protein